MGLIMGGRKPIHFTRVLYLPLSVPRARSPRDRTKTTPSKKAVPLLAPIPSRLLPYHIHIHRSNATLFASRLFKKIALTELRGHVVRLHQREAAAKVGGDVRSSVGGVRLQQ